MTLTETLKMPKVRYDVSFEPIQVEVEVFECTRRPPQGEVGCKYQSAKYNGEFIVVITPATEEPLEAGKHTLWLKKMKRLDQFFFSKDKFFG